MPKSFDELYILLVEMKLVYMKYTRREIGIEEYGAFFRRKDAMIVQLVFLMLPLIILSVFQVIPWYVAAGVLIEFLYAGFLLSFAKNMGQHMLLSFVWAVTSFAVVVLGMLIYAYFDAPPTSTIGF